MLAKSVLLSHFYISVSKLAFATQMGSCVQQTNAEAPDKIPRWIQSQPLLLNKAGSSHPGFKLEEML